MSCQENSLYQREFVTTFLWNCFVVVSQSNSFERVEMQCLTVGRNKTLAGHYLKFQIKEVPMTVEMTIQHKISNEFISINCIPNSSVHSYVF